MAKKIDINGFWEIKDNPLTKEGVFPYLGNQIDPSGERFGLDPKKIYWVYRSFDEIANQDTLSSFENKPFIDEHTMLGEGCTSTDCKNIAGVIHRIRADKSRGMMIGDFTIFSDEIKREIMNGKKELSLGYRSAFEQKSGVFDGRAYEFIQTGMIGNHVALVDRGRCGSDVRIFDKSIICDHMEIPQMELNREELKAILDGMDEEMLVKAKAALEGLTSKPVEDEHPEEPKADEDDPKKVEDECKDEESKPAEDPKKDDEKKPTEDAPKCEDKESKPKEDESKPTETKDEAIKEEPEVPVMDEAAIRKDAAIQCLKAQKLHDALVPHIGEFTMDEMFTEQAVAEYGCKKLVEKNLIADSDLNAGSELATLTGFLAGCKDKSAKVVTVDHDIEKVETPFDFRAAYLAK